MTLPDLAQQREPGDPAVPAQPAGQVIRFRAPAAAALPTTPPAAPCFECQLRELCLPAGLDDAALHMLDGTAVGRRRLRCGQALFREGETTHFLYAVRSGSFKCCVKLKDGGEQVLHFSFPGDLLGQDGLAGGRYASTAIALEESDACALPLAALQQLADTSAVWRQVLYRVMSGDIVREYRHARLLGSAGTEGRVAAFLLELAGQMQARGYSPREFHMRMSRAEIGSYLGMTLETVSRTLSAFQHDGLLAVQKRHIRILDLRQLQQVVQHDGP